MAVKGLVAAIVQFLTDQLQDGDMTADSRESLEVAIQCLESAYSVQASDAPSNFNLYNVYKNAVENAALGPEATPEAKAEAERLKNEGNALMKADKHQEALANYTKYFTLIWSITSHFSYSILHLYKIFVLQSPCVRSKRYCQWFSISD